LDLDMSIPLSRNTRSDRRIRLGVIINPASGLGGKVALKGTDGFHIAAEAIRRGAVPMASVRARRALSRMNADFGSMDVLTGFGELGETVVREFGIEPLLVGGAQRDATTADDTRVAAGEMARAGADLILFAGGDGTARDIFDAVGERTPVLGVPSGVKMYSGIFGITPEKAGDVASDFLANGATGECLRFGEIMDIDEDLALDGRPSPHLYGYARVPYERSRVQHAKAGGARNEEVALEALCRQIAATMDPDSLYVFGPGTTTQAILRAAGIHGTLLGVDAVCGGRLAGADLTESDLLALSVGKRVRIVVGVIGGQGFLFGRGNQQISAEVIRRAGNDQIIVVSSLQKILALDAPRLFVDTGDAELDASLRGYIRVETAPSQSLVCGVV
jgi:predicted polyphosphate/ATP-dependent NAD kinase